MILVGCDFTPVLSRLPVSIRKQATWSRNASTIRTERRMPFIVPYQFPLV